MLPLETSENLKVMSMAFLLPDSDTPVAWRGPMKHTLFQQFLSDVDWGELDYLIVDLPPGTGDEPMSIAQILGSPLWAIIVTTPQDVALLDSREICCVRKEPRHERLRNYRKHERADMSALRGRN